MSYTKDYDKEYKAKDRRKKPNNLKENSNDIYVNDLLAVKLHLNINHFKL